MEGKEIDLLKEFIQRQEDFNDEHSKNTQKILRALYGEKENETVGLVQVVKNLRTEQNKQKNFNQRLGWTSAGFIIAINLVWITIKEFFLKK